MKSKPDRMLDLLSAFASAHEREDQACRVILASLSEALRLLQTSTADKRFQRLNGQLKKLKDALDHLAEMVQRELLTKVRREAEQMKQTLGDSHVASVFASVVGIQPSSLNGICDCVLDRLVEVTDAERGFILFYVPETTEADVVAARSFSTTNLSLEEYSFSRTLLQEVFRDGQPLLIEDAANDSRFSHEFSVRNLNLKSVLVCPLVQDGRAIGAVYLENNKRPAAFDHSDRQLLVTVAQFAVFYLEHARLLPVVFARDARVYFDASKASKEIVGRDPKMLALHEVISRIADSPATVLIDGESGTGKELVARALHFQGHRRGHPFMAINCAAIPDDLLESELFGHERGAFTGAMDRYTGRIEQANGGTVFLDELSELAYPLQAKLLRFLQSHEFNRLGGKDSIQVDVRVVAATSKDLKAMAEAGRFQDALYYRLNVIPLSLPALRERKDDIPLLVDHFLDKFAAVYGKKIDVDPEVYEYLKEYSFPGNARELENLIHRVVALSTDDSIRIGDLPEEILQTQTQRVSFAKDPLYRILHTPPGDLDDIRRRRLEIKRVLAEQESELAERAVESAGGNLSEAARRLGVHRITLLKMVKRSKAK